MRRIAAITIATALAAAVFTLSHAVMPEAIRFTNDEATYAIAADDLLRWGDWPDRGPGIAGLPLHLGTGYIIVLAAAVWLTGGLVPAISGLIALNAAAVAVAVLATRRTLGDWGAVTFGVLLAASPLLYEQLEEPLLHMPYGYLPVVSCLAATWHLDATGDRRAWLVAVVAGSLSCHFHLTWWPVLAPVAVAVWRRRSDLPPAPLLLSAVIWVLLDLPFLASLDADSLGQLADAASGHQGPAPPSTAPMVATRAAWATPGGWIALGLAAMSLLMPPQASTLARRDVVVRSVGAMLAAYAGLWFATGDLWVFTYTVALAPSLVLLVLLGLDTVAAALPGPQTAVRAAVLITTTLGAGAHLHARWPSLRKPGPHHAVHDLRKLAALDQILRIELDLGRQDVRAGRVHGLLCARGTLPPCRTDSFESWMPAGERLGPDDHKVVRWTPDGPLVMAGPACLTPRQGVYEVACEQPVALHIMVDIAQAGPGMGPEQLPQDAVSVTVDGTRIEVRAVDGLQLGGHNTVFLYTAAPQPLSGELHVRTHPAASVLDVYVAGIPTDLSDLGWSRPRPPPIMPHRGAPEPPGSGGR